MAWKPKTAVPDWSPQTAVADPSGVDATATVPNPTRHAYDNAPNEFGWMAPVGMIAGGLGGGALAGPPGAIAGASFGGAMGTIADQSLNTMRGTQYAPQDELSAALGVGGNALMGGMSEFLPP